MMKYTAHFTAACFCLLTLLSTVQAQNSDSKPDAKPAATDTSVTTDGDDAKATVEGTNEADATEDGPETVSPAKRARDLLKERKAEEAAEVIDAAIENAPHDQQLHVARQALIYEFMRARDYTNAFAHSEKALQYAIDNVDKANNALRIASQLSVMRVCASRASEKSKELSEWVDEAYDATERSTREKPSVRLQAMSMIAPIKTNLMISSGKRDQARTLIAELIGEIKELEVAEKGSTLKTHQTTALARLLFTNATMLGAEEKDKEALDAFFDSAIEETPDSLPLLAEYSRTQAMLVSRTYRNAPKLAQERIERALNVIGDRGADNVSIRSYIRQMKSFESRIESAIRLTEMVGDPAPEFDVESWVNQGDTTLDNLKGKVVLVDFWSVWCGPCIATFPHLREWREEFGDKGFEIVGVTRYYNYTWDEENERATRSKEEVSGEEERAMLKKFLASHDLKHPTIITPSGSTMQKEFGVTGIPHVVVIDREGIVRLVKVGAGKSTAAAIHETLTELIDK